MNLKSNFSLAAIVPVYNEEQFIKESLTSLLKIEEINTIFVIDDNSQDDSLIIIREIANENSKVIIHSLSENKGKGGAIKSIFHLIEEDYVIIHDADLEYNPRDIIKLYKELDNTQESNFIIGSRLKTISNVKRYYRTFYANKILSFLFSKIYKIKISDIASCYKMMPTKFLKNNNFEENGFAIEVELISRYLKNNSNIVEVPITYEARSYKSGKKIKFIDGFRYLIAMFKYR